MGEKSALRAKAPAQAIKGRVNGITFDAGGLIAVEKDDRRVFSILATALEDGDRIIVPATALAQVIRNPARQVRLWRMIQFDQTEVVPLDRSHAQAVGALLSKLVRRTSPMLTSSYVHKRQGMQLSRATRSI